MWKEEIKNVATYADLRESLSYMMTLRKSQPSSYKVLSSMMALRVAQPPSLFDYFVDAADCDQLEIGN